MKYYQYVLERVGWALLTVVSTVILTVVGGLLVGLDLDPAAVQTASRVAAAGLLGAALAAPMALVSSWRRGYLPGIVALMALVVVTQIVTAMGAGAWFPFAAPALWMGMGGAAAASSKRDVDLDVQARLLELLEERRRRERRQRGSR